MLVLAGCEPDLYKATFIPEDIVDDGGEVATADIAVDFDLDVFESFESRVDTKAPVLSGAEKKTGVLILVYRSSSKMLHSYKYFTQAQIAAGGLQISAPLSTCDFYILGNVYGINKGNGTAVDLMTALGASFPVTETELEAMVYRLDGGNINTTYRRETMAEVATYGLPFAAVEKNVNVSSYISAGKAVPQNKPVWLFSKVVVTVDHSLFDGGAAAKLGNFVNKTMYIRQANLKLTPFSTAQVKATGAEDAGTGDYDPAMSNATAGQYVFYVPENVQGTVAGIANSLQKQKNNASIPASVRDYSTYAEFCGTVNAGGFEGDVTYQFYLGANATTDFSLQRGKQYNVTLTFSSANLFGEPEWKVDSDLTDNRNFHLTADEANATALPDGQLVVVRPNRDGGVYVYSNGGGGVNGLKGTSIKDPSWSPSSFMDPGFTTDFLSATNAAADVPSRQWLLDRGITPSYDAATGRVVFHVTNASLFNSHVGEEKVLTFTLLPGDGSNTATVRVKLVEPISITWDDSLVDNFLPGMKRTATLSGFVGAVQYKASDPHMYKNQVATGATGLIDSSYSSSQQVTNGTLPIWCYYTCIDNYTWSFDFKPVDSFNDGGVISFPIRSRLPFIVAEQTVYYLEVSGKEEVMTWHICVGSQSGTVIPRSAFDDAAFAQVYPMQFGFASVSEEISVEGEHSVYDPGTPNAVVGLSYKGTTNSYGYPDIYIYRKGIGSEYDIRAGKDVRIRDSYVYGMPACSNWNGRQGKFGTRSSLNVRLLPFVSAANDIGFQDKYHDFTLTTDADRFDSPYCDYAQSYASASNATFYCTDRTAFSLYAKPTCEDSMNYGEASESVIITQEEDGGRVLVSFVNDGSNMHSAGPHTAYAAVSNKWSGETVEVELGSFEVYVDFVCGVEYFASDVYTGTTFYLRYLNGSDYFNRTTFDQELSHVKGKLKNTPYFFYDNGFGQGFTSNFVSIGAVSHNPCVSTVSPIRFNAGSELFALSYGPVGSTEWDGSYTPDIVGSSGGPASLARNSTGVSANMVFVENNPYTEENQVLYLKHGDLYDSDNNGYYVFRWLKDVCADSRGWINVFYDYQ